MLTGGAAESRLRAVRFIRPLAFAVVVAVAVPVEASAACAWVLWINFTDAPKNGTPRSGAWEVLQAVPSGAAPCQAIIDAKVKDAPRRLRDMSMAVFASDENGETIIRYLCLPDTIDPRGPKR